MRSLLDNMIFWNQRIEFYQIGMFLGRSEVSQFFLKIFKVVLLKTGWMCLFNNMVLGISASRSIRWACFRSIRGVPKFWGKNQRNFTQKRLDVPPR